MNTYGKQWMDTPMSALCLKERGDHGDWLTQGGILKRKFGRLSVPPIQIGDIQTSKEFEAAIRDHEGDVIVVGHNDDAFVWRGSVDEFLEMWEVD
jgi:hypothetical protein